MKRTKFAPYVAAGVILIGLLVAGVSAETVLWISLAMFMVMMHIGGHGHAGHGGGHGGHGADRRPDPRHDASVPSHPSDDHSQHNPGK